MTRMLGDAGVAILPVTDGFREMLDAKLKQAMAGLRPDIKFAADMRKATADLAKWTAEADKTQAKVKVSADLGSAMRDAAAFDAALKAMSHPLVKVNADTGKATTSVNILRGYLDRLREAALKGLRLNINNSEAEAKLITVLKTVDAIEKELKSLTVGLDTRDLPAELARLKQMMAQSGVADFADVNVLPSRIRQQLVLIKRLLAQSGVSDFLSADLDETHLAQQLGKLKGVTEHIPVLFDIAKLDLPKETLKAGGTADVNIGPLLGKLATARKDIEAVAAEARDIHMNADATQLKQKVATGLVIAQELRDRLRGMGMTAEDVGLLKKIATAMISAERLQGQLKNLTMDGDADPLLIKLRIATAEAEALAKAVMDEGAAREFAVQAAAAQALSDRLADAASAYNKVQERARNAALTAALVDREAAAMRSDRLADAASAYNQITLAAIAARNAARKFQMEGLASMAGAIGMAAAQTEALRKAAAGIGLDFSIVDAQSKLATVMTEIQALKAQASDLAIKAKTDPSLIPALLTARKSISQLEAEAAKLSEHPIVSAAEIAALGALDSRVKELGGHLTSAGYVFDQFAGDIQGRLRATNAIWDFFLRKIPLFGGALNATRIPLIAYTETWHILTDAILETIAIWVPATLGAAAFAAAAAPDVQMITNQLKNMGVAQAATGQGFAQLGKNSMMFADQFQKAVKPQVWTLFGEGLNVVAKKSSSLIPILTSVGGVVDQLGARIAVAVGSKGFGQLLQNAAPMLSKLGNAFGNLFGIIGNLMKAVPGYAGYVLDFGKALLGITEVLTGMIAPILRVGLEFHGAIFYIGLLVTLAATLGRSLAGGLVSGFTRAGGAAQMLADDLRGVTTEAGALDVATTANSAKLGGLAAAAEGATSRGMSPLRTAAMDAGVAVENAGGKFNTARGKINGLGDVVGVVGGKVYNFGSTAKSSLATAWNSVDEGAGKFTKLQAVAGTALGGVGRGLGNLAKGALGLVGSLVGLGPVAGGVILLGAAIGGVLYLAMRKTTDATQAFVNAQKNLADSSSIETFTANNQRGLQAMDVQLNATGDAVVKMAGTTKTQMAAWSRASYVYGNNFAKGLTPVQAALKVLKASEENGFTQLKGTTSNAINATLTSYKELNAGVQAAQAQQQTYNNHLKDAQGAIKQVTGATLNQAQVMQVITQSGITLNQVLNDTGNAWAEDKVQIAGAYAGFLAMAPAIGGANTALNALNITTSNTLSEIQQVTQAYQTFIGIVTGSAGAYSTFAQGLASLVTAVATPLSGKALKAAQAAGTAPASTTPTVTFRNGKIETSSSVGGSGGVIGGTGSAGIASLAAYVQEIQQAEALINAMQVQAGVAGSTAASSGLATLGGKSIVSLLAAVPGVKGNRQAQAILGSVAQTAGFQGSANDFAAIVKWAGPAASAEDNLNKAQEGLTISTADLNKDAQVLASTMNGQIQAGMDAAIIAATGLSSKMEDGAKAIIAWQQAGSKGGSAINTLIKQLTPMANALFLTTHNSAAAKQQMIGFLEQLGVGATQATAIANALFKNNAALKQSAAQASRSEAAFQSFTADLGLTAKQTSGVWKVMQQQQLDALTAKAGLTKGQFMKLAIDGLKLTQAQADALWGTLKQQYLDALTKKVLDNKKTFQELASELGLTKSQTSSLWTEMHQQYLDGLSGKALISQKSFMNFAENGLHLTWSQANSLWGMLRQQYIDAITAKAGTSKSAFQNLAGILGLNQNQTSGLWKIMREQYLDAIAGKANLTHQQFNTLASKLGLSTSQASTLWGVLKKMEGTYNVNLKASVSGGGKVGVIVSVNGMTTQATKQIGSIGPGNSPGSTSAGGGPVSHPALGGVIADLAGAPGVNAMVMPGELVVAPEFAGRFARMASRKGIPARAAAYGSPAMRRVRGWGNHDSVPAALVPGSLVVPKNHAGEFEAMGKRMGLRGYAGGGLIGVNASVMETSVLGSELKAVPGQMAAMVQQQATPLIQSAVQSGVNSIVAATRAALLAAASGNFIPGTPASGSIAAAQAFARSILPAGWSWPALLNLWNRESGWNAYAVNPSSGAYGIPQSLGHGHPYNLGDYANQIRWGIAYISGRYGNSQNAWAHEEAFNWYGNGGIIPEPVFGVGRSGRKYAFAERGPERVIPASAANGGGPGSPGLTTYQGMTIIQLLQQLASQGQQLPVQVGRSVNAGTGIPARHGYGALGR